jgi:hypothetical protein
MADSNGCRLFSGWLVVGLEHDYTRRSGVLLTDLVLPEGAGEWSRAELWNAAEQA